MPMVGFISCFSCNLSGCPVTGSFAYSLQSRRRTNWLGKKVRNAKLVSRPPVNPLFVDQKQTPLTRRTKRKTVKGSKNKDSDSNGSLPSWQFAYLATTTVTAFVGGPILAAFSVGFLVLGRTTEAPVWLWSTGAVISAALVDAVALNFGNPSWHTSSFLPYIIFVAGNVTAATLDFDGFFRSLTPGTKAADRSLSSKPNDASTQLEKEYPSKQSPNDLTEWDNRLNKSRRDDQ